MELTTFDYIFKIMAYPISIAFIIQMLYVFVAGDGDTDTDVDTDGLDSSYFTIKNFINFFTVFTWTIILCRASGLSPIVSIGIGTISGSLLVLLLTYLFFAMTKLQHLGTMSYDSAVGNTGVVYLTIPENGTGKVTIVVQGTERELEAICHESVLKDIPTGSFIEVVSHISNVLVVKPIN